jgi:hypothetical protein
MGHGNEVLVDGLGADGSAVFSSASLMIGYSGSYTGGLVTVRRGGRLMTGNLWVGRVSPGHGMTISEGGVVQVTGFTRVGVVPSNNGSDSNTITITGSGSLLVTPLLFVGGESRKGNQLFVANGGIVSNANNIGVGGSTSRASLLAVTNAGRLFTTGTATIGGGTSAGNTGLVSGAGSLWANSGAMEIGAGTGNCVRVEHSAVISNAGAIRIGVSGAASGNSLTLTSGGRVQAAEVGVATNNVLSIQGGVLFAGRIGFTNDASLAVGDGTQDAMVMLTNATVASSFLPGLRIQSKATLSGVGKLNVGAGGMVIDGVLAPGIGGIGAFTNQGDVTLMPGSETHVELAGTQAPGAGWDFLAVTNGTLVLGGVLRPVLQSGFMPAGTDRFVIMTNLGQGSVTGRFDNAAAGQAVAVYGSNGVTQAGRFTVEIGAGGVTLSAFREYRGGGAVLHVR